VHQARIPFNTVLRPLQDGLFTQDPAFWQTVHLGGDGWDQQQVEAAAAAKAEWAARLVVKDPVLHVVPGTGHKAAAQVRLWLCLDKLAPSHCMCAFSDTCFGPAPVKVFLNLSQTQR
jgi:hypothetical protein